MMALSRSRNWVAEPPQTTSEVGLATKLLGPVGGQDVRYADCIPTWQVLALDFYKNLGSVS